MTNMRSYEEEIKDFNWTIAEKELEYKPGDDINIAAYCSDRVCAMGKDDKLALIWEGHTGEVKRYTFNDIRLAGNTIGQFLCLHEIVGHVDRRDSQFLMKTPQLEA